MSTFTVNPENLASFANTLNSLGPVMEQMKSVGQQDAGELGGSEIESAVGDFANTWKYGAGQLEKHVENLVQNVAKAAQNYAKTDDNVATATHHVK